MFVSLALLVLSRLDHPVVSELRSRATPVLAPALAALAGPLQPLRAFQTQMELAFARQDEIARLQAENQALKGWEWRARELEREMAALGRMTKLVERQKLAFVTARVVADSTGPFVRSVVIDAGSDQGLKGGQPVVNADGLVGRIVDVAPTAARVLLLTDINSRIPVSVGDDQVRAIAVGDNGPAPTLKHLPRDTVLANGAVAATSGRGGLFPPSLRYGTVVADAGHYRLAPFANLDRLGYVSVLLFESPVAQLVATGARGDGER